MHLHVKARHIPSSSWLHKRLARFYDFILEALPGQECVMYGVNITQSTVKYPSVIMGSFVAKDFEKRESVGDYNGAFLHRAM